MELRRARDSDAEALRTIYNAEVLGSTATFDLVPRTLEEQRDWMEAHGGAYPVIVALDHDTVVGFASLSPYRPRAGYATTVEDSVYIGAGHRGNGIGKALVEDVISLAAAHGFHSVIARIVGHSAASIALHQSCGFTLVGIEREVGRKFGRWLDVAVMQRLI